MLEITELIKTIKESKQKTSAYDTEAVVRRIEGNTAWVHIPGGVDETPVRMTVKAKEGDTVQVRVSGGSAFLVGNATAPPSDDSVAVHVAHNLSITDKVLSSVKAVADKAAKIAGNTNQYFWVTETGSDTGAHITEIPQKDFLADPSNGGGNLLARSNGLAVRDGLTELATFSASLVELGKNSLSAVIKMCAGKLVVAANNYGASINTLSEYMADDPTTYYSSLSIGTRNSYGSDQASALIYFWAGLQGQASSLTYSASQHSFDGKIRIDTSGKWIETSNDILTYYPSTGITDADDIPRMTTVRLGNSHGVLNTPVSNACFIVTLGSSENNKVQFCTAANVDTTALYMRKCSSGTWTSSWKSISFS